MEPRSIEQIARSARVTQDGPSDWALRRARLDRLARLLESTTRPVRLFTALECYPRERRLALRQTDSPMAVAFADPLFREEGLAGDSVGDGVAFFHLSMREAHALLCDCRYGLMRPGAPMAARVAQRARRMAARRSAAEWRELVLSWF
jgi:hypothetical protein